MAKQIIRSIRKGSVQWNEEDRLQMVSMTLDGVIEGRNGSQERMNKLRLSRFR